MTELLSFDQLSPSLAVDVSAVTFNSKSLEKRFLMAIVNNRIDLV